MSTERPAESGVMPLAVRNRIIAFNPCEGVRLPAKRMRDTDHQVISRDDLRGQLLCVVPTRYRGIVTAAAGTGLRWGEAALLLSPFVGQTLRTVMTSENARDLAALPRSSRQAR